MCGAILIIVALARVPPNVTRFSCEARRRRARSGLHERPDSEAPFGLPKLNHTERRPLRGPTSGALRQLQALARRARAGLAWLPSRQNEVQRLRHAYPDRLAAPAARPISTRRNGSAGGTLKEPVAAREYPYAPRVYSTGRVHYELDYDAAFDARLPEEVRVRRGQTCAVEEHRPQVDGVHRHRGWRLLRRKQEGRGNKQDRASESRARHGTLHHWDKLRRLLSTTP